MRKILLVLALGVLTSGCVYHRGFHQRHAYGAHVRVTHVHGHACGHVLVNGVWIVR
jgi:hypothetical protein